MRIRPSSAADLERVRALLRDASLPDAGLDDLVGDGLVVAVDDQGCLLGAAALEPRSGCGLLRSVVTAGPARGRGIGAALVRDRLARARALGLQRVHLLTTSGAEWFGRFGFLRVGRDELPEPIRRHDQFTHGCPSSAAAMSLELGREERTSGRTSRGTVPLVAGALACLLPRGAASEPADVARLREAWQRESRAMAALEEMTTRFGPRLAGSPSHDAALEWLAARLEEAGLHVRVEEAGELAVGFRRGLESGVMVAPERRRLHFATPTWSAGTSGPRRGRAVLAADAAQDPRRMAGAWILASEDALAAGGLRDAAARHRAAGIVLEADESAIVVQGVVPGSASEVDVVPRILLRGSEWRDLERRLLGGEAVELEFDLDHELLPGPRRLRQVVADIRGSGEPGEVVLLGAHLDTWDGAVGATDNGAGVAATLEAARLLAESGARPRRTLRFAFFTGEELGLIGSRAYVSAHSEELPRHVAALVMDAGGGAISGLVAPAWMARALAGLRTVDPSRPFTLTRSREERRTAGGCAPARGSGGTCSTAAPGACAAGAAAACARGASCGPRSACAEGGRSAASCTACGSDDLAFTEAGVPSFLWKQEQDRSGSARTHHTDQDHLGAIDASGLEHSARLLAMAALLLGDAEERGSTRLPRRGTLAP